MESVTKDGVPLPGEGRVVDGMADLLGQLALLEERERFPLDGALRLAERALVTEPPEATPFAVLLVERRVRLRVRKLVDLAPRAGHRLVVEVAALSWRRVVDHEVARRVTAVREVGTTVLTACVIRLVTLRPDEVVDLRLVRTIVVVRERRRFARRELPVALGDVAVDVPSGRPSRHDLLVRRLGDRGVRMAVARGLVVVSAPRVRVRVPARDVLEEVLLEALAGPNVSGGRGR
jgi:hypothetical protein